MSSPAPTVTKWITYQLADLTERGPITKIELYHTIEDANAERLQSFNIKDNPDPNDLAGQVWETCELDKDSRPLGDQQRYALWAFRADSTDPDASHAFLLQGRSHSKLSDLGGESSDPPNERGHMGQMMRQNGEIHRQMMIMTDQFAVRLSQELDAERKRREKTEDRVIQIFELHQGLLDRTAQRELDAAKEQAKEQRHQELMGMFMSIGPVMIAKFLGQDKLLGQAAAPSALRDSLVGKFLEGLSPTEMNGVIAALRDMRKVQFLEIWKSYKDGDLDKLSASVRDQGIQNFLESMHPGEPEAVMAALGKENRDIFIDLYKSYGRSHQEAQEKKPIPFRKN